MKKIYLSILLLAYVFIGTAQQIDTEKSIINFKVPKAEGTIGGMTGEVILDLKDLNSAKFNVSINPNTINTDNKKRDSHLRTEDFFNVELFPKIIFTSTKVMKIENSYVTMGTMNLHGVIQKVNIDFTIEETVTGMVLKGNMTLNQKDFEMAKKDKNVDIEITCVLKK
jgi:polyisoprenoid-binding protein YceI